MMRRPAPGTAHPYQAPEAPVNIDERFVILREHVRRRHQCDFAELEAHLDQLQAEVAELLRRTPPPPDTTPAKVVVTVH